MAPTCNQSPVSSAQGALCLCQPDHARPWDIHIHDGMNGVPWSCVTAAWDQGSRRKSLGAELVPVGSWQWGSPSVPRGWRCMNSLTGHGGPRQNQHRSKDACAQERDSEVETRGGQRKERSPRTHLALLLLSLSWKESGRRIRGWSVQVGCLSLPGVLGPRGGQVCAPGAAPRAKSHHGQGKGAMPPKGPGSATNGLGTGALLFPSFASCKHQEGGPAVASSPRPTSSMPLPGPSPSSPTTASHSCISCPLPQRRKSFLLNAQARKEQKLPGQCRLLPEIQTQEEPDQALSQFTEDRVLMADPIKNRRPSLQTLFLNPLCLLSFAGE